MNESSVFLCSSYYDIFRIGKEKIVRYKKIVSALKYVIIAL